MSTNQCADYRSTSDVYSQQSRRMVGGADGSVLAELVIRTCGFGRTLDVGSGEGHLVGEFLKKGLDAYGLDLFGIVVDHARSRWPNRFNQGSVLALPYQDGAFHTVVSSNCLECLAPHDVPAALKEIHRVSSRFVFLQIATRRDDERDHLTAEGRAWWETRCFEVGFRKHAAYYDVNRYESLNSDGRQIYVVLEKIPAATIERYPLATLERQRLLHMDMLRETGRRGDAHCIRYHMAAQYIRPGDIVLDVACGLGYGSFILFQNSQAKSVLGVDMSEYAIAYAEANYAIDDVVSFRFGDAQKLSFLADNSVDFVAGFETIEHVPNPAEYLSELKRVLRPSGRLMVCAPNDWTDESGKDPNPHHLHVYTWEKLFSECSSHFLLEKGFVQTAGGAMKCHNSPRKWREVPLVQMLEHEAEWILLLCMVDPVEKKGASYTESLWKLPTSINFNVAAFARDYENPWLVRGMIAIGLRNQSTSNLRSMQKRILEAAATDSVDYGAALCGRAYDRLLESPIPAGEYKFLLDEICKYAQIVQTNPHVLRWQVSLLFVGAELARAHGKFNDAERLYLACAEIDVMRYSPLLGNKTLDALFWLARITLGRCEYMTARYYLTKSVEEAKRLVSGSWLNICGDINHPLPFGLAEIAQLMDKASRAAYMLASLDDYERRPGILYSEAKGFYERQFFWKDSDLSSLRNQVVDLTTEVTQKSTQAISSRQDKAIWRRILKKLTKISRHAWR